MKYNFSKIEIFDIDGKKVEESDAHKLLANLIYRETNDLDMVEKARDINKGEDVELDKVEIETVKTLINKEPFALAAFARKAIIDYIDSVK